MSLANVERDIGPLSLERIVRFAGAVQDFNSIHYDPEAARAAGLPGVIAQGPLTFLIALDALIAANGIERLQGFQARLKAPVMPGVPLAVSCNPAGKVSLKAGGNEALAGTLIAREA